MRYNGKLKELNHIIISDPSYDNNVSCRYERKGINAKNWDVTIDMNHVSTPVNEDITIEGIEFYILLQNPNIHCQLKNNGSFSYTTDHKICEIDIGIDTACICLGINDYANTIIKSKDIWQPDCSLKTNSDGIFGYVKEGKLDNKTNFIWISGYICSDTGYSHEDILNYLESQLQIIDLKYNDKETILLRKESLLDKLTDVTKSFKELIKEDTNLLDYLKNNNIKDTSISLSDANRLLKLLNARNNLRQLGKLEGDIEKSPFTEEQENLIYNFEKLQDEYRAVEYEIEESLDLDI